MTDKADPQTPVSDPNAPTPDPAKGAAGGGSTPSVDVQKILAENAALKEREGVLVKSYQEVRKFATQKAQEAAALRKAGVGRRPVQTDEIDLGEPEPDNGAGDDPSDARLTAIEGRQAVIDFKLDHNDLNAVIDEKSGKTVWVAMQELLDEKNPISMTLAGATPYLTLQNAYKEVELQRLRAGAKSPSSAGAEKQRVTLRSQAFVSGQSATEGGEVFDLDNATAEEVLQFGLESGLFQYDKNDPPKAIKALLAKKK